MWMPTSDDQEIELMIPTNPSLEIVSVSVQYFRGCECFPTTTAVAMFIFLYISDWWVMVRGTSSSHVSETA